MEEVLTAAENQPKQQIRAGKLKIGVKEDGNEFVKEKQKLVKLKKVDYLNNLKSRVHEQRTNGTLS